MLLAENNYVDLKISDTKATQIVVVYKAASIIDEAIEHVLPCS